MALTFAIFMAFHFKTKKTFHNVMQDGADSVNFSKCKIIAMIYLLNYEILTFGSDCFVGLKVITLVTLLM